MLTTPTLRLDVNAADVCSRVASKAAERLRQTMADFRPIVILDVVLGRENECNVGTRISISLVWELRRRLAVHFSFSRKVSAFILS